MRKVKRISRLNSKINRKLQITRVPWSDRVVARKDVRRKAKKWLKWVRLKEVSSDKIKWLSLWCEEFAISFGDLVFNSKKGKENSCAPGAKRAPPAALAPATLPAFLAGLGITNEQLAIILANPQLLQQLQQQGLFPQLQR